MERTVIARLAGRAGMEVLIRGWVRHLRQLASTTFIVVADASGSAQCVAATSRLQGLPLKLDDCVEIRGTIRAEPRSRAGYELDIAEIGVIAVAAHDLPFNSGGRLDGVAPDVVLRHRPLSLRTEPVNAIFRAQGAIVRLFRDFLAGEGFTEIFTPKIVAGGTEGGSNLFEIKYFERTAYLAQSPQFYKEHGVAGLERVFETGYVYRAEPHATSRHLTEYYSLDLELGFIDSALDVIELERRLLDHIFAGLNDEFGALIAERCGAPLPSMRDVPVWEFGECLDRLRRRHGREDLIDDLDPEAERQLCAIAGEETGVPALFVLGFPLSSRPFYTKPRGASGAAESFDLLFRGLEITTGGERLHRRDDLTAALLARGIDPASFDWHLRMFELGMPPHGGLAIGLERLTMQALNLANVREATMYPRDRAHIAP